MSVNVMVNQCPSGHWGRSNELDRVVSVRCVLEMGHKGPHQLVDQLAHLPRPAQSQEDSP